MLSCRREIYPYFRAKRVIRVNSEHRVIFFYFFNGAGSTTDTVKSPAKMVHLKKSSKKISTLVA
jgi:hypothetical protein